jgi:hypothetical protein
MKLMLTSNKVAGQQVALKDNFLTLKSDLSQFEESLSTTRTQIIDLRKDLISSQPTPLSLISASSVSDTK